MVSYNGKQYVYDTQEVLKRTNVRVRSDAQREKHSSSVFDKSEMKEQV